jgi:hypothetical protein
MAMSQTDDVDAKLMHDISKKVLSQLKTVRVEEVNGKKRKPRRTQQIDQREKLRIMIKRIESSLAEYESTDQIDNWDISFSVGVYYGDKTFQQIQVIHNKLISAGNSIDKLRLLNFAERGSLYDFLKNSDGRHGEWNDICKHLDVCRRTVDRYIDFFHIINAYPRLIVCKLSFEAIMSSYKQLNEYFNAHDSLSDRLKLPLKQTRLCGGGIFSSRRMPGGHDDAQVDAPSLLQSEGASWDPAWQLADELFDSESDVVLSDD